MNKRNIKACIHCNELFDIRSKRKIDIGGKINECPDCLEEMDFIDEPRYLGVMNGEGKVGSITILAFESQEDRDTYHSAWRNNSGFNVGKKCQMGGHHTAMQGMRFKKIAENRGNENHKGKA